MGHPRREIPIALIHHHLKFYLGGLKPLEHELMQELLEYGKPPTLELVPDAPEEAFAQALRSCMPLATRMNVHMALSKRRGRIGNSNAILAPPSPARIPRTTPGRPRRDSLAALGVVFTPRRCYEPVISAGERRAAGAGATEPEVLAIDVEHPIGAGTRPFPEFSQNFPRIFPEFSQTFKMSLG